MSNESLLKKTLKELKIGEFLKIEFDGEVYCFERKNNLSLPISCKL